jgi:hypothetical protein
MMRERDHLRLGLTLALALVLGLCSPALADVATPDPEPQGRMMEGGEGPLRVSWIALDDRQLPNAQGVAELTLLIIYRDRQHGGDVAFTEQVLRLRLDCKAKTLQQLRLTFYDQGGASPVATLGEAPAYVAPPDSGTAMFLLNMACTGVIDPHYQQVTGAAEARSATAGIYAGRLKDAHAT